MVSGPLGVRDRIDPAPLCGPTALTSQSATFASVPHRKWSYTDDALSERQIEALPPWAGQAESLRALACPAQNGKDGETICSTH